MSAIRVFLMYNYVYSEFRRDVKARPLFGRSPLFGVSVKREFTVLHYQSSSVTRDQSGPLVDVPQKNM